MIVFRDRPPTFHVQAWYDEVRDFSYPYPQECNPHCPYRCSGPVCTHYTQVKTHSRYQINNIHKTLAGKIVTSLHFVNFLFRAQALKGRRPYCFPWDYYSLVLLLFCYLLGTFGALNVLENS